MQSVINLTEADITVAYCADPEHPADCSGEVAHVIPPGAMFTYDEAEGNGSDITAQLEAATEIVI